MRRIIPKRIYFPVLFLLAVATLLLPILIRNAQGYPLPHSGEAYNHLHSAKLILEEPVFVNPVLYLPINLYDYLLAILLFILPLGLVAMTLPFVLGMLSALLLYKNLKLLGFSPDQRFFVSVLTFLSPIFIYSFTTLSSLGLLLFLTLLGFWLLLRDKQRIGVLVLASLALISLAGFLAACLLVFVYTLITKKPMPSLPVLGIGIGFWIVLITTQQYSCLSMQAGGQDLCSQIFSFDPMSLFKELPIWGCVSALGSDVGYPFISILLSLLAVVKFWRKHKKAMAAFILLFALSAFAIHVRIIMAVVVSSLSALLLLHYFVKRWQLKLLKQLTLLLVCCIVIFASVSYVTRLVHFPPDQSMVGVLGELSKNPQGNVLTLPEYAPYVAFISGKTPLLAPGKSVSEKMSSDMENLLSAQRLTDAQQYLEAYDLQYFLITPEMYSGETWNEEDEGLLLVIRFSESFIKLSSLNGREVWWYREGGTWT